MDMGVLDLVGEGESGFGERERPLDDMLADCCRCSVSDAGDASMGAGGLEGFGSSGISNSGI